MSVSLPMKRRKRELSIDWLFELEEIMIIWISGPYGVGMSTLAEAMADKMKNALIFDAEEVLNQMH